MTVGGHRSVITCDARNPRRWIDKSRRRQIHLLQRDLRTERRSGGVVGVDWPGVTLEFQASVGRKLRRHFEREERSEREVNYFDINLIVNSRLLRRSRPRHRQPPLTDIQLGHGKVWIPAGGRIR